MTAPAWLYLVTWAGPAVCAVAGAWLHRMAHQPRCAQLADDAYGAGWDDCAGTARSGGDGPPRWEGPPPEPADGPPPPAAGGRLEEATPLFDAMIAQMRHKVDDVASMPTGTHQEKLARAARFATGPPAGQVIPRAVTSGGPPWQDQPAPPPPAPPEHEAPPIWGGADPHGWEEPAARVPYELDRTEVTYHNNGYTALMPGRA